MIKLLWLLLQAIFAVFAIASFTAILAKRDKRRDQLIQTTIAGSVIALVVVIALMILYKIHIE